MYNRLLAFGDSFTFGYDLDDCKDGVPSNQTYSALLAKQLNIPYHCHAVGGNANQSITRNILNTEIQSDDLVIIMWTFEHRQDFLLDGERGWASIMPDEQHEFSTLFYKYVDNNIQYFDYLSHKEIFLIQQYLNNLGCTQIHCCVTSSLFDSVEYKNTKLTKQIVTDNWISLPGPSGFYDWAKTNFLTISARNGHANKIAHQKLFELMIKKFAWLAQG